MLECTVQVLRILEYEQRHPDTTHEQMRWADAGFGWPAARPTRSCTALLINGCCGSGLQYFNSSSLIHSLSSFQALGVLLQGRSAIYELLRAVVLLDKVAASQVSVLVTPVNGIWHVEHLCLLLTQQPPAACISRSIATRSKHIGMSALVTSSQSDKDIVPRAVLANVSVTCTVADCLFIMCALAPQSHVLRGSFEQHFKRQYLFGAPS